MKLYSEEQVRTMIGKAQMLNHNDEFLFDENYLIQQSWCVELPSDEEIEEYFKKVDISHGFAAIFGAKWVRDKIGGNK